MRAVVSFANTPFYRDKMKRLQESVEAQGIKFIGYTSCEEVGCRPHSEVPYQFKPYAIQKAISEGVTTLLWCDSPIVAIKDIRPVFDYIEEHGYCFFRNWGHNLGKWTNLKTLDYFHIEREESMEMPMIMACCMGFHFNKPSQIEDTGVVNRLAFFKLYKDLSDELYPDSWTIHRHDQSVISCLIRDFKFSIINGHETFFMYEHFKDVFTISPSVCLVSR